MCVIPEYYMHMLMHKGLQGTCVSACESQSLTPNVFFDHYSILFIEAGALT